MGRYFRNREIWWIFYHIGPVGILYYINEPVQCTCVYVLRVHFVGRGRANAFFRVVYAVYTEGILPTVIWVPATFTIHFFSFFHREL